MCGRFQKTTHYTLHATACLDQHLITISSPTVLHNHWLSLQPCGYPSPARRVSLSLSVCAAVYCTYRQSVGKLPPEVPCWARSSGPQVAVVISRLARLNASRPDFDPHTSRNWPTSWLGIKLLHHRRLSPTLLSSRVEFSGPRRSRLAALLPIFSSRVCIRGRSYVQGNNSRGCN